MLPTDGKNPSSSFSQSIYVGHRKVLSVFDLICGLAISHFIWNRKESVQLCHDRLAKLSLLLLTVISERKVVYLDQTRQELVNIVLKGPNKKYTFGCFLYVHKLGTILTGGQ